MNRPIAALAAATIVLLGACDASKSTTSTSALSSTTAVASALTTFAAPTTTTATTTTTAAATTVATTLSAPTTLASTAASTTIAADTTLPPTVELSQTPLEPLRVDCAGGKVESCTELDDRIAASADAARNGGPEPTVYLCLFYDSWKRDGNAFDLKYLTKVFLVLGSGPGDVEQALVTLTTNPADQNSIDTVNGYIGGFCP